MRYILLGFVAFLPLTAGCQMLGYKKTCGLHIEILCPPTIETSGTVMIQQGQPITGAHPMGQVSGPITEGQNLFAPAVPQMSPAPPLMNKLRIAPGVSTYDPCAPRTGISAEEWCRIMGQMQSVQGARPLPNPTPTVPAAGKEDK